VLKSPILECQLEKADNSRRLARFEGFELDLRAGELSRQGNKAVQLSDQPFRILAMLLARPGDLVTREEIRGKLWPNGTIVEFEHSISAAMNRLRQALGDSPENPRFIETLARRGYRWKTPVEWVESSREAASPTELERRETPAAAGGNLIGKKVSHYRVLEVLGGGGMGVVYKAEDLRLGRRVAVKFLPEELAGAPDALKRFEREARAASALNHPNICTVYEIEEHDDKPFIVMELLEGKTLRDLISSGKEVAMGIENRTSPLPLGTLLDVALQVAQGLEAAHKLGVIHRDIKPANIFVTNHGQAKILDFGLAKLAPESAALGQSQVDNSPEQADAQRQVHKGIRGSDLSLTLTGSSMGTAGYMSPEQVRGENLDVRTDLFSFGLVLYEIAAGQRTFGGETKAILQDAILHHSPTPVRELDPRVPPSLEAIINKALEKDRNLRYQSATEMRADLRRLKRDLETEHRRPDSSSPRVLRRIRRKSRWRIITPVAALLVLGVALWWWRSAYSVSAARITDKDTVVLADFANSTGDPIFDETLRPALRSSLQQSPFINILSDSRVSNALTKMTKPANTRLTPDVARDLCRREQSKAYISGAIAALGNEYVIGLKAISCVSGMTLSEQQGTAENKAAVLKVLGNAVSKLRAQMGESLASVAKYDIPFEQTTSSLEALREYELGMKIGDQDMASQLPHFLRAIQLDPEFAMAYLSMAETYANMNQSARANEYFTKAFELRDHADPRERLEIESLYYGYVTGELDKAAQSYLKTIESYPKSPPSPFGNLSYVYSQEGQYEKALDLSREVLRRYPAYGGEAYEGIAENLLPLHRFDEARQILQSAITRKVDIDGVHKDLYALAFVTGDSHIMSEQLAWLESKPEYANLGLALEAETAAYTGQLRKARGLTDQAVDTAVSSDNKEAGALWRDNSALREALFGNRSLSRQNAEQALKLEPSSQHVEIEAALALAMAHEKQRATKLALSLATQFPLDTQVQTMWLPTINAQLALLDNSPAMAIDRLRGVAETELGAVPFNTSVSCLYPVYVRGEAYLAAGKGNAAASEFQKILDHSGIVWNCPTGALAHLGLARANALEARTEQGVAADAARTRARNAYKDFFGLWKDADPDLPILKEAKAEYAKLQ